MIIWLSGPSGCGKTTLVNELNRLGKLGTQRVNALDLDTFGYRKDPDAWGEWIIPPIVFKAFEPASSIAGHNYVLAGSGSNMAEIQAGASAVNATILALCPPFRVLEMQRKKRGDKPEKVATSEGDAIACVRWAEKLGLTVCENMNSAILQITVLLRTQHASTKQ